MPNSQPHSFSLDQTKQLQEHLIPAFRMAVKEDFEAVSREMTDAIDRLSVANDKRQDKVQEHLGRQDARIEEITNKQNVKIDTLAERMDCIDKIKWKALFGWSVLVMIVTGLCWCLKEWLLKKAGL